MALAERSAGEDEGMSWRGWALAGILCGAINCVAQSFDCTAARTATEKTVCASPELGRLDVRLNAIYRETMALSSPSEKEAMRREQRLWGKMSTCNFKASEQVACLRDQYEDRIVALNAILYSHRVITSGKLVLRTKQVIEDTSKHDDIYRRYPKFEGSPAKVIARLNALVTEQLFVCEENPDSDLGSSVDQTILPLKINEAVVALRSYGGFYCAGAPHPNGDSRDVFFDLQTGEGVDLWGLLSTAGQNAIRQRIAQLAKKLDDKDECKGVLTEEVLQDNEIKMAYHDERSFQLKPRFPLVITACEDAVDASISIDELMQMYPQASPARKVLTALAR